MNVLESIRIEHAHLCREHISVPRGHEHPDLGVCHRLVGAADDEQGGSQASHRLRLQAAFVLKGASTKRRELSIRLPLQHTRKQC